MWNLPEGAVFAASKTFVHPADPRDADGIYKLIHFPATASFAMLDPAGVSRTVSRKWALRNAHLATPAVRDAVKDIVAGLDHQRCLRKIVALGDPIIPAVEAEELEALELVEVHASSYQRKNRAFLRCTITDEGIAKAKLTCKGEGVCAVCAGEGQHLRTSPDWRECSACEGSGECFGCAECGGAA